MGAMAPQITSLSIVYSSVHSGADKKKPQSSGTPAFFAENSPVSDEFPAQMASNAENVSNWWRHHVYAWLTNSYVADTLSLTTIWDVLILT